MMKITKRQLRRIIQEVRGSTKRDNEIAELEQLHPKAVTWSKSEDPDMMSNWGQVTRSSTRSPKMQMEKAVLYDVLSKNGPDVSWDKLGRVLGKVRKIVKGGDILSTWEKDPDDIYDALDSIGMFGRGSDNLRYSSDRYYS